MTRRLLSIALLVSAAIFVAGLVLVGASAVAAGGLYLAEARWMDPGLDLLTIGLGLSALAGGLVVVATRAVRPIGAIALPVVVLALWWGTQLALVMAGPVDTFRGVRIHDIPTWIYSAPEAALLYVPLPTLIILGVAMASIWPSPRRASSERDA